MPDRGRPRDLRPSEHHVGEFQRKPEKRIDQLVKALVKGRTKYQRSAAGAIFTAENSIAMPLTKTNATCDNLN